MSRMAGALSPSDALESDDEDQRREAFAALSRRGDPEAIVLLRRAAASRDPDVALSAALALDEIGERAERELRWSQPAEVRHGTG
jgi:HEAT repeat protein